MGLHPVYLIAGNNKVLSREKALKLLLLSAKQNSNFNRKAQHNYATRSLS